MTQEKEAERSSDRGKQAHSDKADAITRGKRGLREILHTPHKKDVRGEWDWLTLFFKIFRVFFGLFQRNNIRFFFRYRVEKKRGEKERA
jgi:hypothetical protein